MIVTANIKPNQVMNKPYNTESPNIKILRIIKIQLSILDIF